MCTVTYVATQHATVITSNRDEHVSRPALAPRKYTINGKHLFFPKDPKAGGTWFVSDEHGNVAVLLNGAEFTHQRQLPYHRSRGLIVLEMISSETPVAHWEVIDLLETEPFTLVLFFSRSLYQMRWDGQNKNLIQLDAAQNYIWSSSTLYSPSVQSDRQLIFNEFANSDRLAQPGQILSFHQQVGNAAAESFVINRTDGARTLSITQAVIQTDHYQLAHQDLISGQTTNCSSEKTLV